jgi:hypothetical protein
MLTNWYSVPGDLAWMSPWRNDLVPQSYATGYALHVIVFSNDTEGPLTTAYLNEMTAVGLFAWSFMDHNNLSASEDIYAFTKAAVDRYGVMR